jgi:ribosomal protein L17
MPRNTRPQNANAHPGLADAPKPRRAKEVIEAEKQAKAARKAAKEEAARSLVAHENTMKTTQKEAKEGARKLLPPTVTKVQHKAPPTARKALREAPLASNSSDVDDRLDKVDDRWDVHRGPDDDDEMG